MNEHLRLITPTPGPSAYAGYNSAIEERFPRIANELSARWHTGLIDAYLDSLLIDTRGGRQGFPAAILDELMFLSGMRWHLQHETIVPQDDTKPDAFSFCATNESDMRRCGTSGAWVLI